MYLEDSLIIDNNGIHVADNRVCARVQVSSGVHSIYVVGFEAYMNSELEMTYSGPDTYDVRTVMGGQPFFSACDPRVPTSGDEAFTLCTFKSDPSSVWNGDCTPTVGIAHPRFPGPCAKSIGTTSQYFQWFSGGFYVPVLGLANDDLVRIRLTESDVIIFYFSFLERRRVLHYSMLFRFSTTIPYSSDF